MKSNTFDSEFLFELGIHIKIIRQSKNITQETLSKLIGVKKSTITRIELGQVNTTICMLYAISKGLEIGLDQLISIKPKN